MATITQKVIKFSLLIIIVMGLIWGNTYYRQVKYFKKAENLRSQKKILESIAFYEAAIRMYTPWSSKVQKSIENIWHIGENYQKSNSIEHALIAFRSLKTSLYAIRSFYSPFRLYRDKAEEKVSLLMEIQKNKIKTKTPL
ncbi:hypothetical protein ACFL27_22030 [candidate division CSSED10-310 bacterium]|uniref:Tetratricopeptide repeat protein n=1 Tax=candidate division CSSED10-310 bacterium TaxID=2855610 RepID=A0ABV6Z356_UNCC1